MNNDKANSATTLAGYGITDAISTNDTITIANGGTGATTASDARSNLGLGTAATYSATSSVTSGSTALITSGAVYSKLSGGLVAVTSTWLGTKTIAASGTTIYNFSGLSKSGYSFVLNMISDCGSYSCVATWISQSTTGTVNMHNTYDYAQSANPRLVTLWVKNM